MCPPLPRESSQTLQLLRPNRQELRCAGARTLVQNAVNKPFWGEKYTNSSEHELGVTEYVKLSCMYPHKGLLPAFTGHLVIRTLMKWCFSTRCLSETNEERQKWKTFAASSARFSTQSFSVWGEQWRRLCSSAWGVNLSPNKDTVYRVIIGSVLRLETHRAEGGRRSRRAETKSSGEFSTSWINYWSDPPALWSALNTMLTSV